MAKRKTTRRSRFADDAALQALVRYGPEETGLQALAQQARADYGVAVRQAQTTGDLTLRAAQEAIPGVAKIYDSAGLDQARTASLVSSDLAALTGPGAATLQRGGALEVAQQLGNLRSAKAAALEDLTTRQVAARQGQQFGVLNARQKYVADMQKILGQTQALNQQKGAFTASTINSLLQSSLARGVTKRGQDKSAESAAAGRTQSERNSLRSSGIDPDTGQPIPGGKLDPNAPGKKPKPGTRSATGKKLVGSGPHGTARDRIQSVVAEISPYAKRNVDRHKVAQLFLAGAPKDASGEAIKAIPQDWLSIGLDLAYDGHLSARNKRILADRGYSLKQLGFPTQETAAQAAARRRRAGGARRAATVIPGFGSARARR